MAYKEYTPEILAKKLLTDRKRNCVFKSLMYKGEIIGEIKKLGDKLRIAGVGKPTVKDYTGADIEMENKTTYNQELIIDQAKYVNVEVDRIDAVQAQGKVFNTEIEQAKRVLGVTMDEFLAGKYDQAGSTVTNDTCKSTNVLSTLAEAEQKLMEADVNLDDETFLVLSPAVYTKLVLAKIVFQQTNKDIFGKGFKGSYLNFDVFVSNSIQKTGDVNHCMAFSRDAIALAEQIPVNSIERYKPEKKFADAFKALHLYGATVIRPAELVRIDITTADEVAI